jgi:hypothetical protein
MLGGIYRTVEISYCHEPSLRIYKAMARSHLATLRNHGAKPVIEELLGAFPEAAAESSEYNRVNTIMNFETKSQAAHLRLESDRRVIKQ